MADKLQKRLLKWLDRVPPAMCRMMAVKMQRGRLPDRIRRQSVRVRSIPLRKLVEDSGISRRNFIRISRMTTWSDVKVSVAEAFSKACGVDLMHENPTSDFLKRKYQPGMPYFTKKQREMFDEVLRGK